MISCRTGFMVRTKFKLFLAWLKINTLVILNNGESCTSTQEFVLALGKQASVIKVLSSENPDDIDLVDR